MYPHIFDDLPGQPSLELPQVITLGRAVQTVQDNERKLYRVTDTKFIGSTATLEIRVHVRTQEL